jgi:hypothetical protein
MRPIEGAQSFAEYNRSKNIGGWHNQCQRFVRSCVGAGVWAPSARLAFNAIPAQHKHTSFPPPPGSIAYYGSASKGNGHTAFASSQHGYVYSNDIRRDGKIDLVPWNVFASVWGMNYRGWIDWTPSGPIDLKPGIVVPPRPPHTMIPTVSLSRLQKASHIDPPAPQGKKSYPSEVLIVEKALNRAGLLASKYVDGCYGTVTIASYKHWQLGLGYTGSAADGIPGMKSLTALGKKYGFRVSK